MELKQMLQGTGIPCPEDAEHLDISGIAYDSRKVAEGNIFVCIKGYKTDGHKYAKDAAESCAKVIIAQEIDPSWDFNSAVILQSNDSRRTLSKLAANLYGEPSKSIKVFGITGTNGKTSITYLLRGIFDTANEKSGVLGTIAYSFGNSTQDSSNTTPESLELQEMFQKMMDYGTTVCAMEVSSHSLALSRVADVSFDYGVFTNLTPDHMDFHGDFDDYYNAKKKLFFLVNETSSINIDDPYGNRLYKELMAEGKPCVSYSANNKDADYYAEIIAGDVTGTDVQVYRSGKVMGDLHIATPGRFSVYNALAALSIASEAGYEWETIKGGLEKVKGVPGRFQLVGNSKGIPVIVDYAHTPDALEKVLTAARELVTSRLITVFGCGGDRDRTKRPLMGEVAGRLSDVCVVTDDNPRTEDPQQILDDIIPGLEKTGCEYKIIEHRRRAIKKALSMYEPGDVVLIAGKGHENYQIIGTVKQYFDDCETAQQIIEQEI